MIDRTTARKALKKAQQNPSAFSTEELEMLMQAAEAPEPRGANLGEGGSVIGGLHGGQPALTGGDLLDQRITQPEMHAEADRKVQEIDRARKEYPNLGVALGVATDEEAARLRAAEELKKNYDEKLPTASKRKDFARPAEFIPPPPQAPATNPIEAFTSSIDKARSNLPAFVGGKVEHYLEPPIQQFRREMAPKLGDRVMNMTIKDREYAEYSDQLWQQIYDKAQQEGRSVVRTAYKEAKTPGEKFEKGFMQHGAGTIMGLAAGVDDVSFGAFSGAAEAMTGDKEMRKNLNRLGESAPVARVAGQLGGAMLPGSPGTLAARGASGLIREGAGIGRAAMRAGVGGAASGAVTSASMDVADERPIDPTAAGISALLGFPLAAGGGAIGQGLKGARANLRADKPNLAQAEKTGMGKTSFWKGISRTDKADDVTEAATAELGPGREVDYLAGRAEQGLTKAARRLEQGTAKEIGEVQEGYFAASQYDERPVTGFLNDAMKLRKGLTSADGRAIALKEPQIKYLDKIIAGSSNVEVVPAVKGRPLTRASRPGAVDMTLEEAELAGIKVDHAIEGHRASRSVADPGGGGWQYADDIDMPQEELIVRVTPRELTAKELETMKSQLDLEFGFGDNPNKQELSKLMRSAREARDAYPARGPIPKDIKATVNTGTEEIGLKGFSAFQRQASERTQDVQRTARAAGFPEKNIPERLPFEPANEVFGNVSQYLKAGRHPDADASLRRFAAMGKEVGHPNLAQEVEDVAGMRGLLELEKELGGAGLRTGVGALGGAGLSVGEDALSGGKINWKRAAAAGLLGGAFGRKGNRLRLDALSAPIIPGALSGAVGGAGAQGRPKKDLPKQIDPGTLEELRMMMGPFLF